MERVQDWGLNILTFEICFRFSSTKAPLWHWIYERNTTYLCFTSLQPKNISIVQAQAGTTSPQKALSKAAVALNTCSGSPCGPVPLYRILGSQQRNEAMHSDDPQAGSGRAEGPHKYAALGGMGSSVLKQVSGWLGCELFTQIGDAVSGRESTAQPQRYWSHQRQIASWTTYPSLLTGNSASL